MHSIFKHNSPNMKPWKKLDEKVVLDKYGRKVVATNYRMPDGKQDEYYIKHESDGCAILALDKDNRVILVRQYRPGPDKILLEMPAGFIDKDDKDMLSAAKRELAEETGYEGDVEFVACCFDDAYSIVKKCSFVAKNCVLNKKMTPEKGLDVKLVSLDEFRKLLQAGQLTDVELGYQGLDYLGLL